MPVEIRELNIKVAIGNVPGQISKHKTALPQPAANIPQQQLLEECVAAVLEILRERHER